MDHSIAIFRKILLLFCSHFSQNSEKSAQLLADADWQGLCLVMHSLKAQARGIGGTLLARIAVQLSAHKRKPETISPEIAAMLTENERKVAELLYQGYTGKEIGDRLFFSYSYIKKLTASLKVKLDADTPGELMRKLRK